MSEVRTVSTPAAESAVQAMAAILSGDLSGDLTRLRSYAMTLSDPQVWDGRAAEQFRSGVWHDSDAALKELESQLAQLRQRIDVITRDIMAAG